MTTAIFRFEASSTIGAGHAIRSCVIADALMEQGWICKICTTSSTYEFIKELIRFERIEPDSLYANPVSCNFLVIDNYNLSEAYEKHFRPYAQQIMVIDDLANRKHDCDILLDQTYGRESPDYHDLVPPHCKILTGSDYILLRKEFAEFRTKAIDKRTCTKEIKKILISFGGSDPHNYTLKALKIVKDSGFAGTLDIILGFSSPHYLEVKNFLDTLPNSYIIHIEADMPHLMYEADLAIGAAGSSVWERCCLGLPSILMKTAENQALGLVFVAYYSHLVL